MSCESVILRERPDALPVVLIGDATAALVEATAPSQNGSEHFDFESARSSDVRAFGGLLSMMLPTPSARSESASNADPGAQSQSAEAQQALDALVQRLQAHPCADDFRGIGLIKELEYVLMLYLTPEAANRTYLRVLKRVKITPDPERFVKAVTLEWLRRNACRVLRGEFRFAREEEIEVYEHLLTGQRLMLGGLLSESDEARLEKAPEELAEIVADRLPRDTIAELGADVDRRNHRTNLAQDEP